MTRAIVYDRLGYNRLAAGEGLRPVLRYARVSPVNVVTLDYSKSTGHDGSYSVVFCFADGATCETLWQDWRVLLDWLKARRSWSVSRVTLKPEGPNVPHDDRRLAALRKRGTATTGFRTAT